ncbi:MAG: MauE/DoxX family redox-associated membrane protein [Flagellimonas sp.]
MKGSKHIMFWLPYLVSILYVILFIYAATSKLWDFHQFKIQLGQSPVLTAYADWVAWLVPLTEYILAFLLLWKVTRAKALYASLGLMTMFTTYIILVLSFSDYVPCSCGGVLEDLGWTEHIVFNLLFVVLAVIAIVQLEASPTPKTSLS